MTISSRLHVPWEIDGSKYVPSLPLAIIDSLPSAPLPYAFTVLLFLVVVLSIHHSTSRGRDNSHELPLLNPKHLWEFSSKRAKLEYHMNSTAMIFDGMKKYAGKPFRLLSLEYGEVVVLPPRYANEIKNDRRFNFGLLETKLDGGRLCQRLHAHLPGFRTWEMLAQENRIVQNLIQYNLTPSLSKITGPLAKECELLLGEMLPEDTEWHEVVVKEGFIKMVARLSTVAFSGHDLARNAEWIELTTNYTIKLAVAAVKLAEYPAFLRRLLNLFIPECRFLRTMERQARQLVESQLAIRRRQRANGDETEYNDVLEWFEEQYQKLGGVYEPALVQLIMSFVAIHTTTDLLSEVILALAQHQELFGPLRQEIREALSEGQGLNKTTIYQMKLLDSVIKETQRTHPVQNLMMERRVMEDVTLSDNIQLKRDSATFIMSRLRDAEVYEKPDEFDPYRFYRLRQQPGKQNTSQLVTTSPDYLAFGHGMSACPGRFFAAQEIKVILCQLLLRFDWHMPEGGDKLERITAGNSPFVNPLAKIVIRRREESEIEKLVLY